MRVVDRFESALEMAKRLSRDQSGKFIVVRLSMLKPIAWRQIDVDVFVPDEDARWNRYCVVPEHTMSLVEGARNPKSALLSVGIFDAPIAGDDRFYWLQGGSFTRTTSYTNGLMGDDYDPFNDDEVA